MLKAKNTSRLHENLKMYKVNNLNTYVNWILPAKFEVHFNLI